MAIQIPALLAAQGARALRKYHHTGRPDDLDAAVAAFRSALSAAPPGYPHRALYQSDLGNSLHGRFELTGDRGDLDAAVDAWQQAVTLTLPGDPDLARRLFRLGNIRQIRFELAGDRADLEAAIDAAQRAAALTPAGHPGLAACLAHLGFALRKRFELAADRADLDAAIDAGQRAVAVGPPPHPASAMALDSLSCSLHRRFELTGDRSDLDAAIDAWRRADAATSPGDPYRAELLSNMGISLRARFELAGDSADLEAAIDAGRQAVALTPPGHQELPGRLSNLSGALHRRFTHAGDGADLEAAISARRQAVALTPPGHPELAVWQAGIVLFLADRFALTGNSADLDDAIDAGRQAVTLTPPGHTGLPLYQSNLAVALGARFELTGDSADLDDAISTGQAALAGTLPGYAGPFVYESNQASWLSYRFGLTGDAADLDAAISLARQAVARTPPGHVARSASLETLGTCLLARFRQSGDSADVDAAIDAVRQAVTCTPLGHHQRAGSLSRLGQCLGARFEQAGDGADLDAAIDAVRQAVTCASPGHRDFAAFLGNLGSGLAARFSRSRDSADLDAAIGHLQQASATATSIPAIRLRAATEWGDVAAAAGRWQEAADGYAAAVGLMPVVAWHGLNRGTRERHLAELAGLAAEAAAYAVLAGQSRRAVEVLEQGRSVLWSQALNLRSDLDRLAGQYPEQAARLDSIRQILDAPALPPMAAPGGTADGGAADGMPAPPPRDTADLRRRLAREWDEAVAEVRALDGFRYFLAATPYPELAAAAADGPVVIINVGSPGSHALIVTAASDQPDVVDLPGLSPDTAAGHAAAMQEALADATDRHDVMDVLGGLWDAIAEPALAALGYTSAPEAGAPWTRVWWCPTGPLSLLPIHAAGHYPRRPGTATNGYDCVPDRVISSYIPTLAALARARQTLVPAPIRHLTVGMPDTPGLPSLLAVPAELEILARHFPPDRGGKQLIGPQATRDAVARAAVTCSWAHFACHARQDQDTPDGSGLALFDGTLTITDLAAQPSGHRDLAFLSACETAAGSRRHPDEAIHLAAALQFLGYRHVIATMWTIADSPAPGVADSVYAMLARHGTPDPERAAEALHRATRILRQQYPADPRTWAPYIHLGA